jgi:hypothetical protein
MCKREKMKAMTWGRKQEKKGKNSPSHMHTHTTSNAHQRLFNNTKNIVRGIMV